MKLLLLALAFAVLDAQIVGFVDYADCNSIQGWAADRGKLNVPVSVDYTGGSVLANGARPDVGAYLKDNGLHGFSIKAAFTGLVNLKVSVGGVTLSGGARSFNCLASTPTPPPPTPQSGPFISTGIMIVNGEIVADGTVLAMWTSPAVTPCRPKTIALDATYFYVCVQDGSPDKGKWKKVRWE